MVREVQRSPADHVLLATSAYTRTDGALAVYRDGLMEFLHRRLFRLLLVPELGRERIVRTCGEWGCVNPYHYRQTGERIKGSPDRCPNGHEYTPENLTPSGHCLTCATRRSRKRAKHEAPNGGEINANKTTCPQGHSYLDPSNVYRYKTDTGWHRKCKTCAREATERRRSRLHPNAVVGTIVSPTSEPEGTA